MSSYVGKKVRAVKGFNDTYLFPIMCKRIGEVGVVIEEGYNSCRVEFDDGLYWWHKDCLELYVDDPLMVYIASPYTQGNVVQNVRTSLQFAEKLREAGYLPFSPLLFHFWDMVKPHDYEYWMGMCLDWVAKANAVIRVFGESKGADREVELAKALGIPVYYSIEELMEDENV